MTASQAGALLRELFDAAVARACADDLLAASLPVLPAGRTIVVGAGKASASMAASFERLWPHPLEGLVITRYGHGTACERIEIVEAGHPLPDEAGHAASGRIAALVEGADSGDLVVALISGGGSALLSAPAGPLTVDDERDVTAALLRSGAPIAAINCVRTHVSAMKGGRLALAAAPARVATFVVSDVPGDDPSVVASGPTLADATTRTDALAVLDRYAIDAPSIRRWLDDPASETPKAVSGDAPVILATAAAALDATAALARERGLSVLVLGDAIEGEARAVAADHAALVRSICAGAGPITPPCVVLSGGETTVTVRGEGRGGRNTEYLLALAVALEGLSGVHALAADTDGIDGSEDNAGAVIGPETLALAAARGVDAAASLDDNDAYGFFARLDALLVTGPTRTNVNDFRAILIDAHKGDE